METYVLTGKLFADMIKSGAANLKNNAQIVNDLNVFPIPDGDTGDNMSRTISGGAARITDDAESLADVADKIADGMLMSARGNSGVILSQFFEGLRKGLTGHADADATVLSAAFESGVRQAYSAVIDPTEGTILTVMREATEKASSYNSSLESFFDAFISETYASLERTPDLLPILKESGVIDSGGAGFVYILEGMNSALRGKIVNPGDTAAVSEPESSDTDSFVRDSEMKYGYCTELIVQLTDAKTDVDNYNVDTLVSYLGSIGGESIVAFRTGTRIKLHVHTFTPEKVLEYCHTIGEFVTLKIENMSIQHTETTIQNRFVRQSEPKNERKKYAVVTVAEGEGLIASFKELGADYVINGNQTMNPSTEDFIKAFDAVNADNIFVLPNNSNIILAANQAAALYKGSAVYTVQSTTLAEGYAALTMLDYTSDDPEEITADLTSAAESVTTGLVTYAVRDSGVCGKTIKKGDYLGIEGKNIIAVADGKAAAATALLDGIDKAGKEVIIMITGKDVTEEEKAAVRTHISSALPGLEFYETDGGQDVYSFIFAIE